MPSASPIPPEPPGGRTYGGAATTTSSGRGGRQPSVGAGDGAAAGTGGWGDGAGARPLAIDLETVSERLHVNPLVLARHLEASPRTLDASPRPPAARRRADSGSAAAGGGSAAAHSADAQRRFNSFATLSLTDFNDMVDGKVVILPGRQQIVVDHSPGFVPARHIQSHRLAPSKSSSSQRYTLQARARTPPPQGWRVRRWWERRKQEAHHVHGVIVHAREPSRRASAFDVHDGVPGRDSGGELPDAGAEAGDATPLIPGALRTPVALLTPHPDVHRPEPYRFSERRPMGGAPQTDNDGVLPIRAVVMPIRGEDGTDKGDRIVAVPMPQTDEDARSMAGSIAEGLLLSTRMRGRMPDEVQRVEVRIEAAEGFQDKVYLVVHFARPFVGWAALALGVFGQAMQGPVIKMIDEGDKHVGGFLLGGWNAQGLCILFSVWSILPWLNGDFGARERAYLFSRFGFALVMLSGIISGIGSGAWTESFSLTSVPQGYLFNSFHPTLIVLWRMVLCRSVLCSEKVGIAIGLVGASLSVLDAKPSDAKDAPQAPRLGDLFAFCSSVSLCFYLLASKKVRPHLPLCVNLMVVTFFSAFSQLLIGGFATRNGDRWYGYTFDNDEKTGLFGWCTKAHFRSWLLLNAVGCVAQAGYIGALKYLNPVVVSICMTCEPVMATWIVYVIMGESLDQQGVGPFTIFGGFAIMAGSIVVSVFSTHHKENVELDVEADTRALDAGAVDPRAADAEHGLRPPPEYMDTLALDGINSGPQNGKTVLRRNAAHPNGGTGPRGAAAFGSPSAHITVPEHRPVQRPA